MALRAKLGGRLKLTRRAGTLLKNEKTGQSPGHTRTRRFILGNLDRAHASLVSSILSLVYDYHINIIHIIIDMLIWQHDISSFVDTQHMFCCHTCKLRTIYRRSDKKNRWGAHGRSGRVASTRVIRRFGAACITTVVVATITTTATATSTTTTTTTTPTTDLTTIATRPTNPSTTSVCTTNINTSTTTPTTMATTTATSRTTSDTTIATTTPAMTTANTTTTNAKTTMTTTTSTIGYGRSGGRPTRMDKDGGFSGWMGRGP